MIQILGDSLLNDKNKNLYWAISVLLFTVQFVSIALFSQLLFVDMGYWFVAVALIVLTIIIGMVYRQRIAFMVGFGWSILLLIHSVFTIFTLFGWASAFYLLFAIAQCFFVTQTEID